MAKTYQIRCNDEAIAQAYARILVTASKWFTFEPLPDGWYEFVVKDEPGIPSINQVPWFPPVEVD